MVISAGLPPRFELRVLEPEHIDWASAIVSHSNIFHSPLWPALYPEKNIARLCRMFKTVDYLMRHQVESGQSLRVFHTEYKFKRAESEATGGKLYWDVDGEEELSKEVLLEQMDFPFVSVAMAYDSKYTRQAQMGPLIEALPAFATINAALAAGGKRDPKTWTATGPGQVLFRGATSARADAEGLGLMAKTARYMMHRSASEGWRGIQIETGHSAVAHVWGNPPDPFKGEIVTAFEAYDLTETDEEGKTIYPMRPAAQEYAKIYVALS